MIRGSEVEAGRDVSAPLIVRMKGQPDILEFEDAEEVVKEVT
jgi:hypothetical protein